MAQGNIIQGQAAGKLGDIVLMVRKGKQVARVYTESGARRGDQATEAARMQRVKFGSASSEWNLLKYFITRMYRKGITTKESYYNYFVKKNYELLPFFAKAENASNIHVLMPGLYSEGDFGTIDIFTTITESTTADDCTIDIKDLNHVATKNINEGSLLTDWQAELKKMYPNSEKVNYLIMIANNIDIDEGEYTALTQYLNFYNVTISMLEDYSRTEAETTVRDFIKRTVTDIDFDNIVGGNSAIFCDTKGTIFKASDNTKLNQSLLNRLMVLVFATNDKANNCYTTRVSETAIPPKGIWAPWYGYRTETSLYFAMSSYGYQTGVMKDEIAGVNDNAYTAASSYTARLEKMDAKSAASLKTALSADSSKVFVKTRKQKEDTEQKD